LSTAYIEYAKRAFNKSLIYRVDSLAGIISTVVIIFVNISIWRAIYNEEEILAGTQLKLTITYIALSFLIQSIFAMDDTFVAQRVGSGEIATDFLKPVNFRLFVLSCNLGELCFKIIQMIPALIICIFVFNLLPPFSFSSAVYFILSLILSYFLLYYLNFIVWISSFWFYQIYSLSMIKEALVLILSGAFIPLWFMPAWLFRYVNLLPFASIYYSPISTYLGRLDGSEILFSFARQLIWIIVFWGIGRLLWAKAVKKLVIQGG